MKKRLHKVCIPLGAALIAVLMFSAGWWLGSLPKPTQVIAVVSPVQPQIPVPETALP